MRGKEGGETRKSAYHAIRIWWRVCWRDELADGAVGRVGDEASSEAVGKYHNAHLARLAMDGEWCLPARVRELDVGYWTKYTSEGQNKKIEECHALRICPESPAIRWRATSYTGRCKEITMDIVNVRTVFVRVL